MQRHCLAPRDLFSRQEHRTKTQKRDLLDHEVGCCWLIACQLELPITIQNQSCCGDSRQCVCRKRGRIGDVPAPRDLPFFSTGRRRITRGNNPPPPRRITTEPTILPSSSVAEQRRGISLFPGRRTRLFRIVSQQYNGVRWLSLQDTKRPPKRTRRSKGPRIAKRRLVNSTKRNNNAPRMVSPDSRKRKYCANSESTKLRRVPTILCRETTRRPSNPTTRTRRPPCHPSCCRARLRRTSLSPKLPAKMPTWIPPASSKAFSRIRP